MKRLAPVLMVLGAVASVATSRGHDVLFDTGGFGREDTAFCDEQLALCVTTTVGGEEAVADSLQVQDADKTLIDELTCGSDTCCLEELGGGSYVLVAQRDGQTVAEPFVLQDWDGCVQETLELTVAFEQEEE